MNFDVKPGWKTSEFWLSLGTTVTALLAALGAGNAEPVVRAVAAAAAAIVPAVYGLWRTIVKTR